jgi:hypothetical protein
MIGHQNNNSFQSHCLKDTKELLCMVVPSSVNPTASYWLKETIKEPISIGHPSDNFARSYWLKDTKSCRSGWTCE